MLIKRQGATGRYPAVSYRRSRRKPHGVVGPAGKPQRFGERVRVGLPGVKYGRRSGCCHLLDSIREIAVEKRPLHRAEIEFTIRPERYAAVHARAVFGAVAKGRDRKLRHAAGGCDSPHVITEGMVRKPKIPVGCGRDAERRRRNGELRDRAGRRDSPDSTGTYFSKPKITIRSPLDIERLRVPV